MTATLILVGAFAKQRLVEMTRYAFDTVASLVMMYVLFIVIFFGVRGLGDITEGQTLSTIILGFNVWALLAFAYSSVATSLLAEAQVGTLEQLAMSPRGLLGTVLIKFWVTFVFVIVQIAVLLVAAMATAGRWLHIDIVSVAPLVIVTAAAILGIGLVMGGLVLVFKRVQAVSSLMQFALIGLVALPVDQVAAVKFVPISLGFHLLNRVMVDGDPISAIPLGDLAILAGSSGVVLMFGIAVFKKMEAICRDRGLLGQY